MWRFLSTLGEEKQVGPIGPEGPQGIQGIQGVASTTAYGTSLPGSPTDGLEAILVDSTTNPTYQWRFRYNAGSSSAYKWEFIGGPPLRSEIVGSAEARANAAYGNLATVGPSITIPRSGDYFLEYGSGEIQWPGVNTIAYMSPSFNGATPLDINAAKARYTLAGANAAGVALSKTFLALVAAQTIVWQYRGFDANSISYGPNRFAVMTPIRVS